MEIDGTVAIRELYGAGLAACDAADPDEVLVVVQVLIGSLEFGYDRAARAMSRIYEDIAIAAMGGRYDEAGALFRALAREIGGD